MNTSYFHQFLYACDCIKIDHGKPNWHGIYQEIDVNEKWFFISRETQREYSTQNKKPGLNYNGECISDGVIEHWLFRHRTQAARESRYCLADSGRLRMLQSQKKLTLMSLLTKYSFSNENVASLASQPLKLYTKICNTAG